MNTSIITVTYNSASVLREFWREYGHSLGEWIVVDNASSDDSVDVARELGARVIAMSDNVGFSRANNRGVQEATGDVLIFCNPDIRVTREGIEQLADQASAEDVIVAPQLLNADGTLQENGRGAPYPHRKVLHMLGGQATQEDRYSRLARGAELVPVVWVMGAALAMSRNTFTRIGGWDESYFIYYEDADICLRALHDGVQTYVDGNTRWTHGWARETARGLSWRAWRHEVSSASRFYLSHLYLLIPIGRRARRTRSADQQGHTR